MFDQRAFAVENGKGARYQCKTGVYHPMENVLFRSAIGGFNRKDVMDYLTTITKENERVQADLKRELEEKSVELESLVSAVAQAEYKAGTLASEQQEAYQELNTLREETQIEVENAQEAAKAAVSRSVQLEAELKETKAALQVALERAEQAERRCQALQIEAESYKAVKERLSDIELSAYERARRVEQQAEAEANALRAKAAKQIATLYRQYEDAAASLRQNKAQVRDELESMQNMLEQLMGSFQEAGADFSALYEEAMEHDPVTALMKEVKKNAGQKADAEPEGEAETGQTVN